MTDRPKERLNKYQPHLITETFNEAVSRVREFGVTKYGGENGWRMMTEQDYFDAAARHIDAARNNIVARDKESELFHIWHAACDLMFIIDMTFVLGNKDIQDIIKGWHEKYDSKEELSK